MRSAARAWCGCFGWSSRELAQSLTTVTGRGSAALARPCAAWEGPRGEGVLLMWPPAQTFTHWLKANVFVSHPSLSELVEQLYPSPHSCWCGLMILEG